MCTLDGCGPKSTKPPIIVSPLDRRRFMEGLIALPLAAVLSDTALAQSAAAGLQQVSIPTASGGTATGALAVPAQTPAPAILLIHEWWGLNDQIKAVAAEYANQGYIALAIDLYGGQVAASPDEARALMGALDQEAATQAVAAAVDYLRGHEAGTGKVGTVGWCFGGGWSLNASIAAPVDATVIYYGNVTRTPEQLADLQGPVMGHFGTLDGFINQDMVSGFELAMAEAGKADQLTVYWYEADHAFANPTGARYDEADAALSWERSLEFYGQYLAV